MKSPAATAGSITPNDIVCASGAVQKLPLILTEQYPAVRNIFVVCDRNTWEAAGKSVCDILVNSGYSMNPDPYIFSGSHIDADLQNTYGILQGITSLPGCMPIAVGSGTINDLVKKAAFDAGIPYITVATAASVDGYTSHGAALLENNFKHTFDCAPPLLIIADTDILNRAPKQLSASGYADLAAKITAGADWILADEMGEEAIDSTVWSMVQDDLKSALQHPINRGKIFQQLAASGTAMRITGKSRSASGAEHLIAHIWEMNHASFQGSPLLHGIKVGLGTLLSTAIMEIISRYRFSPADKEVFIRQYPELKDKLALANHYFGTYQGLESFLNTVREKYPDTQKLNNRLDLFISGQSIIWEQISCQNVPYKELRSMLDKAGCPVRPEDVGISRREFVESIIPAQLIRDRYTILDLTDDLGLVKTVIDEILESPEYLE
ncbi:MAG: sn-glycerol-1-phosphate dehydrogenase [Bacteroidetes bacterium]|nr:sn-glycerol-1-phosphate dehydrogenase [Bacteroidota bacterium]